MGEAELEILRDIKDLLTLIAEPQLAERDKARRERLREAAGRGEKTKKAALLMDGRHTQAEIAKTVPIDQGQLSRLVKALASAELLDSSSTNPCLIIPVTPAVFTE